MGYTKKLRFLLAFGIGLFCSGILAYGMLTGTVAADISLGAKYMIIDVKKLDSGKVAIYGGISNNKDGETHPTLIARLHNAQVANFCLSIPTGNLPIVGDYNVQIKSDKMLADNATIKLTKLQADLNLHEATIGADVPGQDPSLPTGTYTIGAQSANIGPGEILGDYLSADSLSLIGSHLEVSSGQGHC